MYQIQILTGCSILNHIWIWSGSSATNIVDPYLRCKCGQFCYKDRETKFDFLAIVNNGKPNDLDKTSAG